MNKLLSLVAFVSLCVSAQASYLYWQVDLSNYESITAAGQVNAYGLYAIGSDSQKTLISNSFGSLDVADFAENFSFIVELYNSESQAQLGQGTETTYADLASQGYITDELLPVAQAKVWHGGTYTVPEPTSGFLMMVGLALLGLKRRKV